MSAPDHALMKPKVLRAFPAADRDLRDLVFQVNVNTETFMKQANALKHLLVAALLLGLSGVAASAHASDEESLRAGERADLTAAQKYRSAIREAGGAYKESLRECAATSAPTRASCVSEAKSVYQRDMADANDVRRGESPRGPADSWRLTP